MSCARDLEISIVLYDTMLGAVLRERGGVCHVRPYTLMKDILIEIFYSITVCVYNPIGKMIVLTASVLMN